MVKRNLKIDQESYISATIAKLQKAKEDGLFAATAKVRDEEGIMQTFSRIIDTAREHFSNDPEQTLDPVVQTNFSNYGAQGDSLGVGGARISTMDAMDISIAAAVFSLMPYLCVEREMTSSSTNVSYQDLVAEYAQGDIAAGETILGTFQIPNAKVNLALPTKTMTADNGSGGTPLTTTLNFTVPLIPSSLAVVVTDNAVPPVQLASGFDQGGTIFLTGSTNFASSINYKNGTVTITGLPANQIATVVANIDTTADTTGSSILTVVPQYKTKVLTAYPQQLIFKDNQLKNAYLNKLNIKLAGTDASIDYGQIAIGKLINIYIHYVNRLVVLQILQSGLSQLTIDTGLGTNVSEDISGYAVGTSFADTKNDKLRQLVINLNQASINKTGKGITSILCGSRGINKLANSPDFVKSADFDQVNAMVGTFTGIPVLRHQSVISVEPNDGKTAYLFGVYKDPAGNAGPAAFGEFLPVTTTGPVSNFNNPTQVATAMTAYCGVVDLVEELISVASLKFLA